MDDGSFSAPQKTFLQCLLTEVAPLIIHCSFDDNSKVKFDKHIISDKILNLKTFFDKEEAKGFIDFYLEKNYQGIKP